MKKILILTTNRADYYKLEPIINVINNESNLKMYLVVSGSHLLTDYGNTYLNIEYPIYKTINTLINVEDNKFMAESISFGLMKYATLLNDIKPDYVIIHGDRFDILSMINACLLMNINIIHIEGGEVSGGVDNTIRKMASIAAKYHIVSNEVAYNNLLNLVDEKKNVFNFGCPIIDKYKNIDYNIKVFNEIIKELNLPIIKMEYFIVSFHIDTTDSHNSKRQFITLFNTIKKTNKKTILFYPNIDNNDKEIIRYIDNNITENILLFKNIVFEKLAVLIKYCSLFIGNSSSIVRESPVLGVPSILIGMRQKDRVLSKNTYWLKDIDNTDILENKILELYGNRYKPDYLYGDGIFVEKFKKFLNWTLF